MIVNLFPHLWPMILNCPNKTPKNEADKIKMLNIPYISAVGSLMYAKAYTKPNIAHAVEFISHYMSNQVWSIGKQ